MRRELMWAALLAAVSAAPAQARNGDFYVGGEMGVMFATDGDLVFTPGGAAGTTGNVDLGYQRGFDGGLFFGYDLGPVRIEAEASYRTADVDMIDSDFTVGNGNVVAAGRRPAGGDVSVLSFMGNAMVDFGNEDRLSFFIGAGAGYAKLDYNGVRSFANQGELLDDGGWRFAWQLMAGVRQAVSENVDVTLRYRFFNAGGSPDLIGVGGRVVDDSFQSHSLMGGIVFNF